MGKDMDMLVTILGPVNLFRKVHGREYEVFQAVSGPRFYYRRLYGLKHARVAYKVIQIQLGTYFFSYFLST